VACLVASGWVGTANASPTYPTQIMDYLQKQEEKGLPACPPTCLLCHESPYGEAITVRGEGFVETLKGVGETLTPLVAVGGDQPIERALAALENNPCVVVGLESTTPCNTDGDMFSDMAEIRAGTDPQGDGDLSDCPKYGCGASIVAPGRRVTRHLDGTLSLGALGLLALLVRRRRSSAA